MTFKSRGQAKHVDNEWASGSRRVERLPTQSQLKREREQRRADFVLYAVSILIVIALLIMALPTLADHARELFR